MRGAAVITGAHGFLGRHIALELKREGYRIVGVDRSQEWDPLLIDRHECLSLPDPRLGEVLASEAPSVVVHAAGPASVAASFEDPLSDFEGSVSTTAKVLDAVRRAAPQARVIALSSAAVYGNPDALPVNERAPLRPISPYGFHKAGVESLVAEFASVFGVGGCSLRVFSAYGPGLRRQLLWDVCEKATTGCVELGGCGDETRDFVHARDVARAVAVVVERASFEGEVYNVASGIESDIRSVATRLAAAVNPSATVDFSGVSRAGDPKCWKADIKRIEGLGFAPAEALDVGLSEYAQWYLGQRADQE